MAGVATYQHDKSGNSNCMRMPALPAAPAHLDNDLLGLLLLLELLLQGCMLLAKGEVFALNLLQVPAPKAGCQVACGR